MRAVVALRIVEPAVVTLALMMPLHADVGIVETAVILHADAGIVEPYCHRKVLNDNR